MLLCCECGCRLCWGPHSRRAEEHILVEHSNFSTLLKHPGRKSWLDQRSANKASKFRSTFWPSIHFWSSDCDYKRHMRDTKFYLVLLVNQLQISLQSIDILYTPWSLDICILEAGNCELMSDGDSSSCLLLESSDMCSTSHIQGMCCCPAFCVSHFGRFHKWWWPNCLQNHKLLFLSHWCCGDGHWWDLCIQLGELQCFSMWHRCVTPQRHEDSPQQGSWGLQLWKTRNRFWKNFVVNSLETFED